MLNLLDIEIRPNSSQSVCWISKRAERIRNSRIFPELGVHMGADTPFVVREQSVIVDHVSGLHVFEGFRVPNYDDSIVATAWRKFPNEEPILISLEIRRFGAGAWLENL